MPNSETLQNAINEQLNNRVNREGDEYLCRKCGNIVPPEFRFVFHLDGDESVVWGPYCSEECICHAKICTGCNKDFIVNDESQIKYFGDGNWFCTECASNIVHCNDCNSAVSEGELTTLPTFGIKVCKKCLKNNYFTCEKCGELHKVEYKAIKHEDKEDVAKWPSISDYCSSCFKKEKKKIKPLKVIVCKLCGDVESENMSKDGYCAYCINNDRVIRCNHCGKYEERDVIVNNFCRKCIIKYAPCDCCGMYRKKSSMKNINGYKSYKVCTVCQDKKAKECTHCLSLSPSNAFHKVTMSDGEIKEVCSDCRSGGNYCSECKEFHFEEYTCRSNMHSRMNYSYRPYPLFFNHGGVVQDKIYFGFENEINYNSEKEMKEALQYYYNNFKSYEMIMKSDGSIDGYGFEAVSNPMNLSFFRKFPVSKMFSFKPRKDDNSCGLHVHVSRTAFTSDVHIYKLVTMINDGPPSLVRKIAGRNYNSYASQIKEKISSHIKNKKRRKYDAVNLSPKDTIEIRIFRGAKTEYQLRYRIEFVHALISYTRTCSLKDATDEDKFRNYVKDKKNTYPSLARYLKNH